MTYNMEHTFTFCVPSIIFFDELSVYIICHFFFIESIHFYSTAVHSLFCTQIWSYYFVTTLRTAFQWLSTALKRQHYLLSTSALAGSDHYFSLCYSDMSCLSLFTYATFISVPRSAFILSLLLQQALILLLSNWSYDFYFKYFLKEVFLNLNQLRWVP